MVGWHHRLDGHELEQTPGDSEGWGSLVGCSPWGRKELDLTEQLNNNDKGPPSRAAAPQLIQIESNHLEVVESEPREAGSGEGLKKLMAPLEFPALYGISPPFCDFVVAATLLLFLNFTEV